MSYLTREELLAYERQIEVIELPPAGKWKGGKVRIAEMTAGERDKWEMKLANKEKFKAKRKGKLVESDEFRAQLLVMCIVDEKGELFFKPNETGLISTMGSLPVSMMFDVAARINGITKSDLDEMEGES